MALHKPFSNSNITVHLAKLLLCSPYLILVPSLLANFVGSCDLQSIFGEYSGEKGTAVVSMAPQLQSWKMRCSMAHHDNG